CAGRSVGPPRSCADQPAGKRAAEADAPVEKPSGRPGTGLLVAAIAIRDVWLSKASLHRPPRSSYDGALWCRTTPSSDRNNANGAFMNQRPLDGVRVVEMGSLIAGPFAAKTLGDFGADVIKIEPPGAGDPLRSWRTRDG